MLGTSTAVLEWLHTYSRFLVLTHERPDGDAFGSLFGAVLALKLAGKDVFGLIPDEVPARYRRLLPAINETCCGNSFNPLRDFDAVLCLDTSNSARLVTPPGINILNCPLSVASVDHHVDNERYGDVVWIDSSSASTTQLLYRLFSEAGWVDESVARCLMTGLLMDTGGLRFPNTTPEALRTAAELITHGVDYAQAVDALFFREKYNRLLLQAEIVKSVQLAYRDRLAYAVLNPARTLELELSHGDMEGLIDAIRIIDTVEIACLIQPEADGVRFSLRSRHPDYAVNRIANKLGGGGHRMAAGAKVPGLSLAEAPKLLCELTRNMFDD